MSKIFLTIQEASERLGKSVEEVNQLISEGKLQEFKQEDQMMVKSDQVELIATSDVGMEDSVLGDQISLEDSFTEVLELDDGSSSGSAISLADSNEATGISAFDTALGQEAQGTDDEMNLDSFGSGSQLLDLTRESDDSMAGAELMNQSFEDDDPVEIPTSASGIFKRMEDEDTLSGGVPFGSNQMAGPMIVEQYDGAGSGLGLGAMIAASLSMVVVGLMVVTILAGGGSSVATAISGSLVLGVCIPLIVLFILLGVGFVVGRATD